MKKLIVPYSDEDAETHELSSHVLDSFVAVNGLTKIIFSEDELSLWRHCLDIQEKKDVIKNQL